MISSDKFIDLLRRERIQLHKEDRDSDYVKGMMQGLRLATVLVKELQASCKGRRVSNPDGRAGHDKKE
jgi:hypothetical protein